MNRIKKRQFEVKLIKAQKRLKKHLILMKIFKRVL